MRKLPVILAAVALILVSASAATRSPKGDIARGLDIFTAVYKNLQTSYVDTVDAEKSINTAIAAMLDEIDPYTEYIPESEQQDFRSISTGEYGGIGSYITQRGGKVMVSEPREGAPAQRAGLRPGDVFFIIDGDTVTSKQSDEISRMLKGQAGTVVKVTVKRPYASPDSILSFDITREKIEIDPVPYYGVVKGDIGYIELTTFNEKSFEKVRDALLELKKNPAVKSIVLDLRNNGGGLLESAVQITGLFVPKGTEVVRTRGRGLLNERIYKTTQKPVDTEIPLAVLVNGASASAAEIVTGALQDLDRAVIVGDRSFGKGLVQATRSLPYNGLMKTTIAKYYIPSGRCIQAIDYSHRNPDGSVARIPDSLTTVWHTAAGRPVRDGGGITPDRKLEPRYVSRFAVTLYSLGFIEDFVDEYMKRHAADTIDVGSFSITDTDYADFLRFMAEKEVPYESASRRMLKAMKEAAKADNFTRLQERIDEMEAELKDDKETNLETYRDEIVETINSDIVLRHAYMAGMIAHNLRSDPEVRAAADLLLDQPAWRAVLRAEEQMPADPEKEP